MAEQFTEIFAQQLWSYLQSNSQRFINSSPPVFLPGNEFAVRLCPVSYSFDCQTRTTLQWHGQNFGSSEKHCFAMSLGRAALFSAAYSLQPFGKKWGMHLLQTQHHAHTKKRLKVGHVWGKMLEAGRGRLNSCLSPSDVLLDESPAPMSRRCSSPVQHQLYTSTALAVQTNISHIFQRLNKLTHAPVSAE